MAYQFINININGINLYFIPVELVTMKMNIYAQQQKLTKQDHAALLLVLDSMKCLEVDIFKYSQESELHSKLTTLNILVVHSLRARYPFSRSPDISLLMAPTISVFEILLYCSNVALNCA